MAPPKITPVEGQAFVGDSLSDLIRAERLQVRSSLPQAHTQPYQRGQQHGASATQRPLQSLSRRRHMAPRKITPVEGQAFVGDSLSDLIRAERLQVRSSLPQAHTQPYQRGQQHGASATQRPLQSLSRRRHMAPRKITPVEGQAFVGDSLSDLIRAERLQVRSSLPRAHTQPYQRGQQHEASATQIPLQSLSCRSRLAQSTVSLKTVDLAMLASIRSSNSGRSAEPLHR